MPAMTTGPAARPWTSAAWAARSPTAARRRPGRQEVGGGADEFLAQRLRSTPSLHRAPPRVRRCLPRPGRGHRHRPCPPPGLLVPLSLGHPTEITTHPLTYWRGPQVDPPAGAVWGWGSEAR